MQITIHLKRLAAALAVFALLTGCTVAKPAEKKDEPAAPAAEAKPAEQAAPAEPAPEAPPKPRNTAAEQAIVDAATKAAGKIALLTDAVVVEQMATVILEVPGEGTANKAAYKTRVMDLVRAVANASMKASGVTKVHVTAQTDGTHGTPNGEFAATLFFQKENMKTPGAWGNLISTDQMLLEAPLKTIHKDLN